VGCVTAASKCIVWLLLLFYLVILLHDVIANAHWCYKQVMVCMVLLSSVSSTLLKSHQECVPLALAARCRCEC
jgi:hypothetical protein